MVNSKNLVDKIIQYESTGLADDNEMLNLFSYLARTKQINHLQGHYGRTFDSLVKAGYLGNGGAILRRC